MDGGSSDQSLPIIQRYSRWMKHWTSEKDGGQTSAINRGMEYTTGSWLNWLNSDDYLMPSAFKAVAELSNMDDRACLISGARQFTYDQPVAVGICFSFDHSSTLIFGVPSFNQEATFFSRPVWEDAGPLDEQFDYLFDTAFYGKILRKKQPIIVTNHLLGCMNVHMQQKTSTESPKKTMERAQLDREIINGKLHRRILLRLSRSRLNVSLDYFIRIMAPASKKDRFLCCYYDASEERWRPSALF
jgi:GT2 family glycosyltransferase